MAIDKQDRLAYAVANSERRSFMKGSFTPRAVGAFHSMWMVTGGPTAAATPPTGNGEIPTDATQGSFPFTNAAGSDNNYLLYVAGSTLTTSTLYFYDRLFHNSGLNATTTTSTFTQPALTRYTDGIGVEVWLEIYTALGAATATTATISYTNQAGTAGRSGTITKAAVTTVVGEMWGPMALQSGDYGVRSVQSVTLGTTQTSGNFGVVLMKLLASVPLRPADQGASVLGPFDLAFPEVQDDACIAMYIQAGSTGANTVGRELLIGKA